MSEQRFTYVEGKDIYIKDNLTGEKFYQSDLDYLTNLLNQFDDIFKRNVEQQELIESLKKDVAYYEKLNENKLRNTKGMFDEK